MAYRRLSNLEMRRASVNILLMQRYYLYKFSSLPIQVLHAFATEGAHCSKVRDILDSSEVLIDR